MTFVDATHCSVLLNEPEAPTMLKAMEKARLHGAN